jgi:hypothetical protein
VLCRDDGAEIVVEETYISIVGSLKFLTHKRPDIAYSVYLVSRYMIEPSEIHMKAAKKEGKSKFQKGKSEIHMKATNISLDIWCKIRK